MSKQPCNQTADESSTASATDKADETATPRILFATGQIVATPGAIRVLEANQCLALDLIQRHVTGDFGVLPKEDVKANLDALICGARILSSYPMADERIWIITEADRSSTTLLLPEEY